MVNAAPAPIAWLVTCEHGGADVPDEYAPLFAGLEALLASHRGSDPGALAMAGALGEALASPPLASTVTRLLVDLNRSLHHRALFSGISRPLPAAERARILQRYYHPYREAVAERVAAAATAGRRVVHISSHSFVGELDGRRRGADVGLLYDPRRPFERALCAAWAEALREVAPALRVRRNYPYRGVADGLTTALRRRHGDACYAGVELEISQDIAAAPPARWLETRAAVCQALLRAAQGLGPAA